MSLQSNLKQKSAKAALTSDCFGPLGIKNDRDVMQPNDSSSPTGGAQKLPNLDDEPRHQFGAAQWLDDSSFDSTYHDKH